MTVFEVFFGLTAVILGLALTHMAATLQKLAAAGGRVRWAPEPVLLSTIIFLVIVQVWVDQWHYRTDTSLTIGQAILQVLKMLAIYFGAASVLPEPQQGDQRTDLFVHYDFTRWLTYGALIAGLILFAFEDLAFSTEPLSITIGLVAEILIFPLIYLSLILIRWRPYNIGVLGIALVYFFGDIVTRTITQ